jgi:hypothetical protein
VNFELQFQIARGLFKMVKRINNWDLPEEGISLEDLVKIGWYIVGPPDVVAERLAAIYRKSGGFGTLLLVTGKNWADRARRHRSLRRFMEEVAPRLRDFVPAPLAPVAGS